MANMANANAYKIRTGPFAGRMGVDVDTNKTLTIADSGYVQNVIADGVIVTVPATATQGIWMVHAGGVKITSAPTGAVSGNARQLVQISPNAADRIQGGPDGTATDDKDMILAKANAKIGDFMVIHNTGETNGPLVASYKGAWAREAQYIYKRKINAPYGAFFFYLSYNQSMNPTTAKVKENSAATKKRLEEEAAKLTETQKHAEIMHQLVLGRAYQLQSIQALSQFLRSSTLAVDVKNQLDTTPELAKIAEAIAQLEQTTQQKEVNWSPVLDVLQKMEEHLASVPKELPEAPEKVEVDFSDTNKLLGELKKAISSLKLEVKAPDVNVKAPKVDVKVDAPDLESLQTPLNSILEALQSLEMPEVQYTDLTQVEELLTKANKFLEAISKKPAGGGGGGGGVGAFKLANGMVTYAQLETDGSVPVTVKTSQRPTDSYALSNIDDSTSTEYYGYEDKDGNWYIKKLASNALTFAKGSSGYTTAWTNRASQTYASYGVTF